MNFFEMMRKENSKKFTENGATAYNSTGSYLLDLYGLAGAMRNRVDEIPSKFIAAYTEDPNLATKLAFYIRDVREGLGERDVSRAMFLTLAYNYPKVMKSNLLYLAEYGRWDDLISLLASPVHDDVVAIINDQLKNDLKNMMEGKPVSLCAKWMPSINASNKEVRAFALELIDDLGISRKHYRKMLSSLRSYLNVTEKRLSERNYKSIYYDAVPSYAMKRYKNTFAKHDNQRFKSYIDKLQKGEAKINASTLYPYDIVENMLYGRNQQFDIIAEEQWKALPDYTNGKNYLVMADVSGSMSGRPMATSIGLAIYFAQRSKGAFHNQFMTFSKEPTLLDISNCKNLLDTVRFVSRANWNMNTDLEKALMLILNTAVNCNAKPEDLPEALIIISDMEIDEATRSKKWSFYDEMKSRFEKAGYKIPNIIFWNVDARNDTFHADKDAKGVQLASGQSATVFKNIMANKEFTPYDCMVEVLNSDRYKNIKAE